MRSVCASTFSKKIDSFARAHRLRDSLFLMVLAALAVRLTVVAFLYPGQLNPRRDHWPFGYEAGRIARSIASGEGFSNPLFGNTGPTAVLTPVYPYLLAGVFKLFGIYTKSSALVILSLDSLFSALTCLPLFFLARKSFGPTAGIWAGWAWVLFPYAIYHSAEMVWDTCLTTLLFSLLFWMTLQLEHSTPPAAWVGYGLLWGLAALTNPAVLSALPFLAGWILLRLHQRKQNWRRPAGTAALALIVGVMPWLVRNYRTFHEFIPFRDTFWWVARLGNTGDTSHFRSSWADPPENESEMQEYRRLGELSYMAEKRRQVVGFISSHPGWFARVTLRRIVYFWTGFWSLPRTYQVGEPLDPDETFDPAHIIFCTTLTVLALAGLRRAFVQHVPAALPYALMLFGFPLVYYITVPHVRYRHPIDPQMVVLAVYAVAGWLGETNSVAREGSM